MKGPLVVAEHGELVVERDPARPSGRLLRQAGMEASYVDLADPTHLEFDYLRWMRIILRAARARRVLHIGGGACTLARCLAAEDPSTRQMVCEADPAVLEIARAHLGLRRMPGLSVRAGEGRACLAAAADDAYDAVVIDAFVGAAIPRQLVTVEALAEVARVAPLVLVNVVDGRAAREVRAIAAGLGEVFPSVWSLGARVGNTILVAARPRGAGPKLDLERISAAAAADPAPARVTPPGAMARLVAGLRARQDGDSDLS